MAKRKPIKKIYIDTNVLINYCIGQKHVTASLQYLFDLAKRKQIELVTSSLAIVQTLSTLQKKKSKRHKFSKEETISSIEYLRKRMKWMNLLSVDIPNSYIHPSSDLEDCIHYEISRRDLCDAVLTENTADFDWFANITSCKPNIGSIRQYIK